LRIAPRQEESIGSASRFRQRLGAGRTAEVTLTRYGIQLSSSSNLISDLMKYAAARLLVRAAGALVAAPRVHLPTVHDQGGFSAICRLLSATEGEVAADVLRRYGATVGNRAMIHCGLTVHNAEESFRNLAIGDGCHVGRQVLLDLADRIDLGDRVTISMRCVVLTHTHAGESRSASTGRIRELAPVRVRDDAYVGAGAILLPGVTIGEGAVVGAGAVVTKDVRPGDLVLGVPARSVPR